MEQHQLQKKVWEESNGEVAVFGTIGEVLENVESITPNKYTRSVQNLFQKTVTNGIKGGQDNDTILANFKAALADQYPEVVIK